MLSNVLHVCICMLMCVCMSMGVCMHISMSENIYSSCSIDGNYVYVSIHIHTCIYMSLLDFFCQLDTAWEERLSMKKIFLHNFLWSKSGVHFLDCWLIWLGLAHCSWCHLRAGGPEYSKKAGWESHGGRGQVSKEHSPWPLYHGSVPLNHGSYLHVPALPEFLPSQL
jgi:hypothetical protein